MFGATNVSQWSHLDNRDSVTRAPNAARITAAILYASQYIERRLAGRFAVPLTGEDLTGQVKDWCAKLAGVWLYEPRGLSGKTETDQNTNAVRLHKGIVNEEIDRVMSGMDQLRLTPSGSRQSTAPYAF